MAHTASYDEVRPTPLNGADGREQVPFDLNMKDVLEHWPVSFAVREIIANALDEHAMSDTAEPSIVKDDGWRIVDYGRGVRYQHLTQNENPEKLKHPAVIGQFGIGLKDALAVCDRRGVGVEIRSRHGDITTEQRAKAGVPDVVTLHAVIRPPSDPNRQGTEVRLTGVADEDIEAAKHFFLRYSGETCLETTRYGDVFARPRPDAPGRVFVKGLLVAEEPNFLFSYNVTNVNAPLRKALNRERTNVGRSAYSDRIKDILKACQSAEVAGPLTKDLAGFMSGGMHDELTWKDVSVHACRVLQTRQKVVFVSALQLQVGSPALRHAQDDGYELVVVPDDIAAALRNVTDLDGRPMFDLGAFQQAWNDSFTFSFVDPADLSPAEQAVYALTAPAAQLAKISLERHGVQAVLISETMRLNEGGNEVVGLWDADEGRIVIKRDQLRQPSHYCGTLLHELTHAATGWPDGSLEYEEQLTAVVGTVTSSALSPSAPQQDTKSRAGMAAGATAP